MFYQLIAQTLGAHRNCVRSGNKEWEDTHETALHLFRERLPSGSGLDLGPRLDLERSTPERLVFSHCAFHHLDEHGGYDGWTEHEVVVTPSLQFGFHLRVTGRDRDGIKEYIGTLFHEILSQSS